MSYLYCSLDWCCTVVCIDVVLQFGLLSYSYCSLDWCCTAAVLLYCTRRCCISDWCIFSCIVIYSMLYYRLIGGRIYKSQKVGWHLFGGFSELEFTEIHFLVCMKVYTSVHDFVLISCYWNSVFAEIHEDEKISNQTILRQEKISVGCVTSLHSEQGAWCFIDSPEAEGWGVQVSSVVNHGTSLNHTPRPLGGVPAPPPHTRPVQYNIECSFFLALQVRHIFLKGVCREI